MKVSVERALLIVKWHDCGNPTVLWKWSNSRLKEPDMVALGVKFRELLAEYEAKQVVS